MRWPEARKTWWNHSRGIAANRNAVIVVGACSAVILVGGTILALTTFAQAKTYKSSQDFVQKAAIGGAFEIQSSQLALDRAKDPDVEQFAQTMIDDHTRINEQSNATLAKSSVDQAAIHEGLDSAHQKMLDKLSKVPAGIKFDRAYMDAQRQAHDEAVNLFSAYAQSGDDPALKDFAARTLSTLKHHQEMAQSTHPDESNH